RAQGRRPVGPGHRHRSVVQRHAAHQGAVDRAGGAGGRRGRVTGDPGDDADQRRLLAETDAAGGASPDVRVLRGEVFGPILPVVAVDTLGQALELANDTGRGLTAFVFSQSYPVINEVNRRIKSGALYV